MSAAETTSPFVFVGGLHRSGTGLIRDLIAQHEAISTLRETGVVEDEGHHVQTALPAALSLGRPGRFAFRRDAHLTGRDAPRFPDAAAAMCLEWAPYWRGGGDIFLEKSPITLVRSLLLADLFPQSRFIFVVRHPVAVSYATQKWTARPRLPIPVLMRHWLHAQDIAARDATQLEDRVMFVCYERLLTDPQKTISTLHRFCGLSPVPIDESIMRLNGNDAYLRRWSDSASTNPMRYRATLAAFRARFRKFGYDIAV